jgi:hypothetical protein
MKWSLQCHSSDQLIRLQIHVWHTRCWTQVAQCNSHYQPCVRVWAVSVGRLAVGATSLGMCAGKQHVERKCCAIPAAVGVLGVLDCGWLVVTAHQSAKHNHLTAIAYPTDTPDGSVLCWYVKLATCCGHANRWQG